MGVKDWVYKRLAKERQQKGLRKEWTDEDREKSKLTRELNARLRKAKNDLALAKTTKEIAQIEDETIDYLPEEEELDFEEPKSDMEQLAELIRMIFKPNKAATASPGGVAAHNVPVSGVSPALLDQIVEKMTSEQKEQILATPPEVFAALQERLKHENT